MSLYLREIAGVLRLELKKTFFSKRGWWVDLLALGPLAITGLPWISELARRGRSGHSIQIRRGINIWLGRPSIGSNRNC